MKKFPIPMKMMQWMLTAILATCSLGMLSSCEQIEQESRDVLCQWVTDYAEEGTDSETGLAYNHVVEVYEFFDNYTGYYECYLFNDGELVNAEYVRGGNGDFRYDLDGDIDLRSTMKQRKVNLCLNIWLYTQVFPLPLTLKFNDGILDDEYHLFKPSTDAQRKQILQWHESLHSAGIAMIVKDRNIDYWRQIESAFREICQEKGLRAFYYGTSADMAYDEQIAAVEAIGKLKNNLLGIIYTPSYGPDGENADAAVAALAQERGIPVVILDSEIKDNSLLARCPYYGTDNRKAGLAMAEKVDADKVAAFAMQTSPGMVRAEAFKTVKPGTDIYPVDEYAFNDVEAVVDDYDDFVFFNGNILVDALDLLLEKGKNVYTFDVYGEVLDELIAGNPSLKGIMSQNTFGMAKMAVEAVLNQVEQGVMVPTFYVDEYTLGAPELQPFLKFYDKQVPVIDNLAEKILGKWMESEIDGRPAFTNEKTVTTFLSANHAVVCASKSDYAQTGTKWNVDLDNTVQIEGNKLTLTSHPSPSITLINEYLVRSISSTEMDCLFKHTTLRNGEVISKDKETTLRLEKVSVDYRQAIQGPWVSNMVNNENKEWRWLFKDNGTYVFFLEDDNDEWVPVQDEFSDYFVDGTLFCDRWKNVGEGNEEQRDWWEVSIKDNVMTWTALRQKEDGSSYTETIVLTREQGPSQKEIEEKILGKWTQLERAGQPALTNMKTVTTFLSTTKATVSMSRENFSDQRAKWSPYRDYDVTIAGNRMTLVTQVREGVKLINEYIITSITDDEMVCIFQHISERDGEVTNKSEKTRVRMVKVTEDYRQDILGTWEGHVTSSEGSEFDDGEDHRWEYKADGSFVYYVKDGDDWVPSDNKLNEYFVDGRLLCTRWIDGELEFREWWEITIEDGVMKWTALRVDDEGHLYTATFSMKKVQ